MAVILRKQDRIIIKINELEFELAPLSFECKMEINEILINAKKEDLQASMKASKVAIMHSIKSVKGLECLDGEKYELEFDGSMLSEECVDDLLNLEQCPSLMVACTSLLGGVQEEILDPSTGKKLEGVEVILPGKKREIKE